MSVGKVPTEQQILKTIRDLTPNSKKYLFDDAALIEKNLVVTTDTLVENTHFTLKTYTPEEIGYKALAVNLSDVAAMGAKPLYALISLSLPKSITLPWIKRFYKGLLNCAKKYKTQIIGGNLTRSKEINITVTLIGKATVREGFKPSPTTQIAKRSNAKPGDLVFTSGTFGDSACGLLLLHNPQFSIFNYQLSIKKHKLPTPQINLGQKIVSLSQRVALMDASDGLADCILQIAKESKVQIIIDEDKIPISKDVYKVSQFLNKDPLSLVLYGGEDYELIGTMNPQDCKRIKGLKIIGKVVRGNGGFVKTSRNKILRLSQNKIFKHFNNNKRS